MSDDPKRPFNNPFGSLAGIKDSLPRAEERAKAEPKGPAKAVVRMERVGRGGKEVTVIEQLDLPVKARDEWLKALKEALGCGGSIEGTALVLQGDQRERVPKLLEKRGVRRVIVG
ncbi:MAG: translation initiation factor [Archangiaceae bacterium]|nr:translation initiation factor [Archangiaceae bacterium]